MNILKKILLSGLLALGAGSAAAQDSKPLEIIVFPGGFNWPIWVAEEKGYFKENQIEVNVTPTPSSEFQLSNLIDGKFDIAMTAVDNLIAYREGQGEAPKVGDDLVAVMGADRGFLNLVAVPEVRSIQDLRGRTVSVDARNTGYALVLFELLDRAGLREPDFTIERAGGVMQRFGALMEKKHAATMLISPFELQAGAQGYNVLANASQSFGAYQGLVAGVKQSWARENGKRLRAYIRSYVRSVEWLYDAANKQEAMDIFLKRLPKSTPAMAEASYSVLVNERTGFQRRAALEIEGLRQVLRLREKWGVPRKEMGPPAKYYDPIYYETSMKP